jgi:hypothetical protein
MASTEAEELASVIESMIDVHWPWTPASAPAASA